MVRSVGLFIVALLFAATPARATQFTLADSAYSAPYCGPGSRRVQNKILSALTSFSLDFVGDSETFTLFELGRRRKKRSTLMM